MRKPVSLSESELKTIGFLKYGTNVLVSRKASIYNPEQIVLGDNIRIDDFCILSGNIKLGSYIHISAYTCLIGGVKGIILQDFVTVSSRCAVYAVSDDFSGEQLNNSMIPTAYRSVIEGRVILEDYVSVGTGSTILPGVKLEEGAAVGAMSFVKHTLEGWKIYAGVPCRYVKDRNQNMKQLRLVLQNSGEYEESR